MAVCISSQAHKGLMFWSIGRSGMTAESTAWKSCRVSSISQVRLRASCRRVVRPSMEAECCTIHREILPKTIVARSLLWAVCQPPRDLRQGDFLGSNASTLLERKEHARAQPYLKCTCIGCPGLSDPLNVQKIGQIFSKVINFTVCAICKKGRLIDVSIAPSI